MRKYLFAVTLLLGLGALPTAAQAQFCPGRVTSSSTCPCTDPFCPVITWIADRGITLGCTGSTAAIACSVRTTAFPARKAPRS